jgi:hypothetical protein
MMTRPFLVIGAVVLSACSGGNFSAIGDAGVDGDLVEDESSDASCPEGMTRCSGTCVDTTGNQAHCGACNHACGPEEACVDGECSAECPAGQTLCSGSCVDLLSNPVHCGECGNACDSSWVCSAGNCVQECSSGLSNCGGTCVDLQGAEEHCGSCFNPCEPGEECVEGTCTCVPDCEGRECGPDGCGDSCLPGCGESETCNSDGMCEPGSDCFPWSGSPSLQDAVNAHDCVEIQEGTFQVDATVYMPAGRELRGLGYTRSKIIPSSSFDSEGCLIVISQSDVVLSRFAIDGASGARAKLNIAVLGADTRNVEMAEMRIDGARCDGLSMGGDGTVIRDSLFSNNGYDCPPIFIGSAIYAEGNVTIPGGQFSHAPQITGNTITDNPLGTAIDMAEVSEGYIAENIIENNGGNGGISIYHGYGWTIEGNTISDSGGWRNYGHTRCEGPHSPATIGIKLCRDGDVFGGTDNNVIRNNTSVGYYGILLAGDDEAVAYLVPRFNELTGNDVVGSTVGCLDDFEPGQWSDGDNVWSGNNCRGTPDTPPDYF